MQKNRQVFSSFRQKATKKQIVDNKKEQIRVVKNYVSDINVGEIKE